MEKSIIEEIRQLTREFIEGNDDAKKRIAQLFDGGPEKPGLMNSQEIGWFIRNIDSPVKRH